MRLRPRPDRSVLGTAERVRTLLAPGEAGWVPPPEPDPHVQAATALSGCAADAHDRPGPAAPDEDEGDRAPSGRSPSESDVPPLRSSGVGAAPAGLRSARLDPGRRAAVALVVVVLLAAVVAAAVVLAARPREVTVPDSGAAAPQVVATGVPLPRSAPAGPSTAPPAAPSQVVVAVAGEVQRPGLVRLPAGSRVDDAVRAAGGPLPGTDAGLLNLARRLVDGEQVLVGIDPPPGSAPAAGLPPGAPDPAGPVPAGAAGPLDLNVATTGDLDALPGIGPVLAQRIVDWRSEHGRFASVEQLREVTGIGASKYADLVDRVQVS